MARQALVKFKPGINKSAAVAAVNGSLGAVLPGDWHVVDCPAGTAASCISALKATPDVESVEPNQVYRPNLTPDDPFASQQYALTQISAHEAWDYGTGLPNTNNVTIAVIDAGVQAHFEFGARLTQRNFCNTSGVACIADPNPIPACNHGTRVAGVAAAAGNNANRIAGLSWGADIVSIRVFNDGTCTATCGGGGCATNDAAVANAINNAVALGGNVVINISLGGAAVCNGAVQTAINNAVTADMPVIVSAGNDGGAVNAPANCANTIPVGATDSGGAVASFSSRGPELDDRGVVAPGVAVLTTDVNESTASVTGTSFSSPYVAGLAALILSRQPNFSVAQVRDTLRQSANNIGLGFLPQSQKGGAGRINAFLAMQLAVKGYLADFQGEDKVVSFPNPFRPAVNRNVFFAIAPNLQGDNATLKIYTAAGTLVKELAALAWDGKNSEGQFVVTGTYVFVLSNAKGVHRGRLAVIR